MFAKNNAMTQKGFPIKLIAGIALIFTATLAAYDLYGPQEFHDGTILTQVMDTQTGSTRGGSRRFEYKAVLIKVDDQKEGLMVRSQQLWDIVANQGDTLPVKINQTPVLGTITKVIVNGVEFDVRFGGLHWQLIFAFSILGAVLIYIDRRAF